MIIHHLLFYFILFFSKTLIVLGDQCSILPSSSICYGILPVSSWVLPTNSSCSLESKFVTPSVWANLNEPCRSAVAQYQCSMAYPSCNPFGGPALPLGPCREWCTSVLNACSSNANDLLLVKSLIPTNCSLLPPSSNSSNNNNGASSTCVNKPLGPSVNPAVPVNSCGTYNGSICAGVINYPIFLNDFSENELVASSLTFLFALMPQSMATTCHAQLALFMCMTLFPKCVPATITNNNNNNNIVINVPAPMSNKQCATYSSICFPFAFTLHNKLISSIATGNIRAESLDNFLHPPCNTNTMPLTTSPFTQTCGPTNLIPNPGDNLSPVFGSNYFPNANSNQTISVGLANPVILSIPNDDQSTRDVNTINMPIICPSPMVLTTYGELTLPNRNSYCAVACPAPYFSRNDWLSIDHVIWICSIFSFICSTIMLSTWLLFPAKRAQTLVLCFIICCFGTSVSVFSSYLGNYPNIDAVGCTNSVKGWSFDDPGSGRCVASGFFTVYFFSSMACWWLLIGFDLFIHLIAFSFSSRQKNIQMLIFHLYGWGLPLILCTIGLASKSFGGKSFWPLCFFSDSAPGWADWTIFYVPLAFNFTIGMILLLFVLRAICISTAQRRRVKRSLPSTNNSAITNLYYSVKDSVFFTVLAPHFRLIVFLMQFAFLFAVLFCVRFHLYLNEDQIKGDLIAWITCLFTGGTNTSGSCGVTPNHSIGITEFYLIAIASAAQGAINFLAYGTQAQNYHLWTQFLRGKGTSLPSSSHRGSGPVEKTPGKGSRGHGPSDSTPGQRPRRILDHSTDVGRKSESGRPPRSSVGVEVSQSHLSIPVSDIDPLAVAFHRNVTAPIPLQPFSSSVNTKQFNNNYSPGLDPSRNYNSSGNTTPLELDSPYTPTEGPNSAGSSGANSNLVSNRSSITQESPDRPVKNINNNGARFSPQLNFQNRRPLGPFPVKRRKSLPHLTTILSERATQRGFDFETNQNNKSISRKDKDNDDNHIDNESTPTSKSKHDNNNNNNNDNNQDLNHINITIKDNQVNNNNDDNNISVSPLAVLGSLDNSSLSASNPQNIINNDNNNNAVNNTSNDNLRVGTGSVSSMTKLEVHSSESPYHSYPLTLTNSNSGTSRSPGPAEPAAAAVSPTPETQDTQ